MFHKTLRFLMKLFWPNISMRELTINSNNNSLQESIKAAKQAYIHDFIMTLPDGYNTIVGEVLDYHGGQKQRLFIARELYRKPKINIR